MIKAIFILTTALGLVGCPSYEACVGERMADCTDYKNADECGLVSHALCCEFVRNNAIFVDDRPRGCSQTF